MPSDPAFRTTGNVDRFDEAVEWFRRRGIVLSDDARAIARDRAFTVAGASELSVVEDLHQQLLKAIAEGTTLQDFKRDAAESLSKVWGNSGARTETIFRNATQSAYNAGRLTQLRRVAPLRPYWQFDAVKDPRTTAVCNGMDGTILPADHPIWATRYPPLHHRCRSSIRSLTARAALRLGITSDITEALPGEGFGGFPDAVTYVPDTSGVPPRVAHAFALKQQRLRTTGR